MTKRNVHTSKKLLTRREFLVGGGAVIAVAALAACTNKAATNTSGIPSSTTPATASGSSSTPKYGGVLKMISVGGGSMGVLGWAAEGQGMIISMDLGMERLLRGDKEGNLVPWLAESYKVADDLKSITFNLQKGVKFHDGSDFNAEVAKWNLDNYINAKMEPYWASVDKIDDYTIRLNVTEWRNDLVSNFAADPPFIGMVSKAAYDKHGVDWLRWNTVGTGPFIQASYQRDVSLKYTRNPDYWRKGKPYLDGIEFVYVGDESTQRLLAQSGQEDIIAVTNPGKLASDYAAMGFTIKTDMNANEMLVGDSAHADSVWANQKVREAVEYAIDREALAKGMGYGYLQPTYQIPPRNAVLAYDPNFPLARKYDPEKAKQLLTEAGYPNGLKTTILLEPSGSRDMAIAIQENLAKVGIQVDLEFPEIGSWGTYVGVTGTWHNAAIICPLPLL